MGAFYSPKLAFSRKPFPCAATPLGRYDGFSKWLRLTSSRERTFTWQEPRNSQINIDYSYCGFEPGSELALLVFGVDLVSKAANLLDELAAEGHKFTLRS